MCYCITGKECCFVERYGQVPGISQRWIHAALGVGIEQRSGSAFFMTSCFTDPTPNMHLISMGDFVALRTQKF